MIVENASLKPFNTFGVAARARWLARLRDPARLPDILARETFRDLPLLVLGEGSNILFARDFEGLIVRLECSRIEEPTRAGEMTHVRVEAGARWHDFVRWSLERGLSGLENLSLIPGTVGAAPIQNIGAYGVELERHVDTVRVYDLRTSETLELTRAQCEFGYRSSIFKTHAAGRYIVLGVRFQFPPHTPLQLDYPGVREELAAMRANATSPLAVSEAICRIRRRKLPDPAVLGNAGSFFKNPIVPLTTAEALRQTHADLPVFPAEDGFAKLSAAWFIDKLGFKGQREGDAGVAPTHALVLVNHGQATGAQIWALALRIQDAVRASFGITLEPEPRVIA